MAKIHELSATTSPADSDSIPVDNSTATKRMTFGSFATWVANKVKSILSIGSASSLKTSSKEIVGAVNEVKTEVDGLQEWSIDISEQVGDVQSSVSSLSSNVAQLNTNIGSISIIKKTVTTDDNGDVYFPIDGYSVLLSAATNTNSANVSWFRNEYSMLYINIKKSDGSPYAGKFDIWALVTK